MHDEPLQKSKAAPRKAAPYTEGSDCIWSCVGAAVGDEGLFHRRCCG